MGHPITRTELREYLCQLNLLTKADLAEFETRMVKWITIDDDGRNGGCCCHCLSHCEFAGLTLNLHQPPFT